MKRLALVPAAGDLRHFAARAAAGMLAATVKKMSAMTSTQTSNQAAARPIAAFLKPQDFSARTAYRPPGCLLPANQHTARRPPHLCRFCPS